MTETVPVLDLAAPEPELSAELASACAEWGFFQVINHGLPTGSTQTALGLAGAFFSQTREQKLAHSRAQHSPWGFYDQELTKNLRDRKEIFDFSLSEQVSWPPQPEAFSAGLQHYARACHALGMRLLALACSGLGLASNQLEQHFEPQHSSFTRLNYYPIPEQLSGAAGPLGISEHTDAGALTELLQDSVAGLQVERNGQWRNVDALPDALTINIGDMLQVWSNDQYRAPPHRVLASTQRERFTIAYFLNPAYSSTVTPLVGTSGSANYKPVPWREFRDLRALVDYGDYGEEVQIAHYRRHQ